MQKNNAKAVGKEEGRGRIKLVIFDFDGTIADTLEVGVEIYNTISHKYNLPIIKKEEINALKEFSLKELLRRMKISVYKAVMLSRNLQEMLSQRINSVRAFKGVKGALRTLSDDLPLGIISSNSRKNIMAFLENNNLRNLFRFVEGYPVIFGKDKKIKKIVNRFHVKPREVAYVGDEVRDVQAAKKAGVVSVACTWGYNSKRRLTEIKPDLLLNSASELLLLLKYREEG